MRGLIWFFSDLFCLTNIAFLGFHSCLYILHPNAGEVYRVQLLHETAEINPVVAVVEDGQLLPVVLKFRINDHNVQVKLFCLLGTETYYTLLFPSL